MDKNLREWTEICTEFCRQKGYTLLFVNSNDFGFEDTKGQLHHVYAEELVNFL